VLSRSTLVFTVLVGSLPLPIQAHDIYSHLVDETGGSCCDNKECRPAFYHLTASGLQMFVDGEWIAVPNERIQYRGLLGDTGETGGGHWCGSAFTPDFPDSRNLGAIYMTKCAILPPNSAFTALPHFR
jgi:hypothetical protein